MKVVVWIAEGIWRAAVDGARTVLTSDAEVVLLHVIPVMSRRSCTARSPGCSVDTDRRPGDRRHSAGDGRRTARAAAQRLDRPAHAGIPAGAGGAGGRRRLRGRGPAGAQPGRRPKPARSALARPAPARFVVDHAPCAVLLVWPGSAPGLGSIPPPPPHPPGRSGRKHPPAPPRPPASRLRLVVSRIPSNRVRNLLWLSRMRARGITSRYQPLRIGQK